MAGSAISASEPAAKRQKLDAPVEELSSGAAVHLDPGTSSNDALAASSAQQSPQTSLNPSSNHQTNAYVPTGTGNAAAVAQITWPRRKIPIEIFNLIADHLPRSDIKNLRLVSREFDHNLSSRYFHTVVVTFRPDFAALYGSLDNSLAVTLDSKPGAHAGDAQGEAAVNSNHPHLEIVTNSSPYHDTGERPAAKKSGMSEGFCVLQQFGSKTIKKFALALELNELDLAYPPLKLNQEIVKAPWGLYRWPIKEYPRYSKLEGLEILADETDHMKKAFRLLTSVNELGISCDAGLGYLSGPDINRDYQPISPAVFKPTNYQQVNYGGRHGREELNGRPLGLIILKQMALNAGYNDDDWHLAIFRLLEDEGRNTRWQEDVNADGDKIVEAVPRFRVDQNTTKEEILNIIQYLLAPTEDKKAKGKEAEINSVGEDRDDDAPRAIVRRWNLDPLTSMVHPESMTSTGLLPRKLTAAQAEMLLELDWAHRALMQSYVIAVMDNRDVFTNLTTLTVARISASHIDCLLNNGFWHALGSINHFSIGVIPEWRTVRKSNTGIEQKRANPLDAFDAVFKLLSDYVGKMDNVKSIHFEWLCGGEFAMGMTQRDRHILPAPVVDGLPKVIYEQRADFVKWNQGLLSLPHVKRLSLKNCWFPPHVFLHMVRSLSEQSLTYLELESVSLTGAPSNDNIPSIMPGGFWERFSEWPWPLCCGAEPDYFFLLQHPTQAALTPLPVTAPTLPPPMPFLGGANSTSSARPVNVKKIVPAVGTPLLTSCRWRAFTWPHVFASLALKPHALQNYYSTCSSATRERYKEMAKLEHSFVPPMARKASRLKSVKFKSCGYALIDHPAVNNWDMIPNEFRPVLHSDNFCMQFRQLDDAMPRAEEPLLAKILNYVSDEEQHILRTLYQLDFGWEDVYDKILIDIAKSDGNPDPGAGRFSGQIIKDRPGHGAYFEPAA